MSGLSAEMTGFRSKVMYVICAVFVIYQLLAFSAYLQGTLENDVNNHILAGEMFGVPEELKARGITPLYYGPGQTGWDGQFYYYIANDLLARKDTPSHIDAPSYRYQRPGMSLYAATIAALTGQAWVSPKTYLLSYFLLVLAATWIGGSLLSSRGQHASLILLWSLAVGTQITMFNALPDAAADSFLIVGLAALYSGRTA